VQRRCHRSGPARTFHLDGLHPRGRKGWIVPRKANPDYVVDPDRGVSSAAAKVAELVDVPVAEQREQAREGLRDLDAMTESMPGLSRLRRDRERILPRSTNAELGHPRMQRELPLDGHARVPLSSRQRKERSKDRIATQRGMPLAQLQAQRELVTEPAVWRSLNDQLSRHAGDVQALAETDQARVRRVDRAIQAYEQNNDRGHVIYTNVTLPWYINHGNVEGFLRNNFEPGQRLSFDRWTAGTHQLHETSRHMPNPHGRVVVFELQTRRGAYMGRSDTVDNTEHLLPRGLQFEVSDVVEAAYRAPDGSSGTRLVVQMRDVTTAGEPAAPDPAKRHREGGPS
jgi:hypothetical protein